MNKRETTLLLSTLLERDVLGGAWSKEVSYSKLKNEKCANYEVGGRVDYMSFCPSNVVHGYDMKEEYVANGRFYTYEIKSCLDDFKSGCGLNFIGDYNYLVISMNFYNELISKDLIPDRIGVLAPVPMYKGKQSNKFFDNAISNPAPLTNNVNDWRIHTVREAKRIKREHGTAELLYAMLISGK